MPASPPTNVIHVVMHDVRADIDTPALSALRSDGATYTFSLAFTQAPYVGHRYHAGRLERRIHGVHRMLECGLR